jgi:uncharacterized RDD family membrane protein YckC
LENKLILPEIGLKKSVPCPTCGLPNVPLAQLCLQCKTALDSPYLLAGAGQKVIDLNGVKLASCASTAAAPQPQHLSVPPVEADWREQLTLKLERSKEKPGEPRPLGSTPAVEDFRDREFLRPHTATSFAADTNTIKMSRPDGHHLVERALEKIDRVRSVLAAKTDSKMSVEVATSELDLEPQLRRRRRFQRRTQGVERIEINLSQGTLPFEATENMFSPIAEDQVQPGLGAAPIASRMRAGFIDAVFLFGCFLIFLLIVFFVPDFVLLTRSSLLGTSGALLLLFAGYIFLFTAIGHTTLGLEHESLRVVDFQGNPIGARAVGLRSFGYIASLGAFGLGFLWAVFDPDRLTWHDKISRTLIIQKSPPSSESVHSPESRSFCE